MQRGDMLSPAAKLCTLGRYGLDLLAEKLQTRSILTLHLVSFQGVRASRPNTQLITRDELKEKLDRGDHFKLVMALGD